MSVSSSKNYEAVTHVRIKEKEKDVPTIANHQSFAILVSVETLPRSLPQEISGVPCVNIKGQSIFVFPKSLNDLPTCELPWEGKHHVIVHWFSRTIPAAKEIVVLSFETVGELFGYILVKGAKGGTVSRGRDVVSLPFDPEKKKEYQEILGI